MKMKILLRGALISSLMVIFSLSSLNSYQIFKNLDPKRMELFTFGPWARIYATWFLMQCSILTVGLRHKEFGCGIHSPIDVTGDAMQTEEQKLAWHSYKGPIDFSLVLPREHFDVSVSFSK